MNLEPSNRSRSGVTLVELMVSVLLLLIVFLGWARMNNIQAVRRESIRYAAVEKAAGFLDACDPKTSSSLDPAFSYSWKNGRLEILSGRSLAPLVWEGDTTGREGAPVLGYRIRFSDSVPGCLPDNYFWETGPWAVAEVYDNWQAGAVGNPLVTLRVFLGTEAAIVE